MAQIYATVAGHGLLITDAADPAEALEMARVWLLDKGHDAWDVGEALQNARVARAWYNDTVGFVQEHHDGAQPVAVVHLPDQLLA